MKMQGRVLGSERFGRAAIVSRSQRIVIALGLFAAVGTASAVTPQVVTVPWRGALDLPHETYNGAQIHLKGVARNLVAGATATWDPGDGTAPKAATVNPDATGYDFDLGVTHTYPASSAGTPFTATLTVCNPVNDCASDTYRVVVRDRTLDVEINIGIDQALWYAHRTQARTTTATDGRWTSQGDVAPTASSVQAFQINGHFEGNDPTQDPYAHTVARGLKYLLSRLGSAVIGPTSTGNPDSNGNGIGINNIYSPDPPYELGQVMDAIVTTKTPLTVTTTGPNGAALPANVGGRTYQSLVQDMVDMYAWGQYKDASPAPSGEGGWRYNWNQFPDNSAAQWGAIGILAARDLFGTAVPAFVFSENLKWLEYSSGKSAGVWYGFGYTGCCSGMATSPSGLVQAVMDGIQKTDAVRWVGVEQNLAANWNSWYRDTADYYRLYALAKAMRLALPSPIIIMGAGTANAIDWFNADCVNPSACGASERFGVARTILRDQTADGFFNTNYWVSGALNHAWGIIILTGTLQLEPVAVAVANPNPGAAGVPINFDGSGSYHQDPAKSIVTYEWDFDADGVPDATGPTVNRAFPCTVLPCNYPVTLTVTDNSTPTALVDTVTISVRITNPPHPPTADANGPYLACTGETVSLNGSGSFDVDQPLGDSITAYGWELDFAQPLDFDDASGATPSATFATAGLKDIGLRVTDNSAAIFGGPNLSHEDFTTAKIMNCNCVSNLAARAKLSKIQLTWAPVAGALSYDIYRSSTGATSGYSLIAAGHVSTYATYLDAGVVTGTTYWYRVVPKNGAAGELCGSVAVSARATAR